MLSLYHHIFCTKSRFASILMLEAGINYTPVPISFWSETHKLSTIDPIGELPILTNIVGAEIPRGGEVIGGLYPVIEYIFDLTPDFHLLPQSTQEKALMRKIIYWINSRFEQEITRYILNEKFIKLVSHDKTGPRTEFIRAAKINLAHHLNYLLSFIESNGNLASRQISAADIFLASHISILDYFGEINWEKSLFLKEWYVSIKSRPSFRKILSERVNLIKPPNYYEELDF